MNTPNPLVPQGTLERQSKGKSTARIAIFTIISIHAVFFAGLLMQGCRRDDAKSSALKTSEVAAITNQNTLPSLDPGYYPPTTDATQVASASNLPPVTSNLPPIATEPTPAPTTIAPPVAVEPPTEGRPYKIAKGDTLAKIAKANGVSLTAITHANPNVDPSKLKVGQTIQIPAASASTGLGFAEPGKSDSNATGTNTHVVKAGETLTRIAKQHNTTVKAIQAANNLKTQRLFVGQKLKLPAGGAATATGETGKLSTTSKLTATNPAHVNPLTSPAATNLR